MCTTAFIRTYHNSVQSTDLHNVLAVLLCQSTGGEANGHGHALINLQSMPKSKLLITNMKYKMKQQISFEILDLHILLRTNSIQLNQPTLCTHKTSERYSDLADSTFTIYQNGTYFAVYTDRRSSPTSNVCSFDRHCQRLRLGVTSDLHPQCFQNNF